jgi:hypothetical protein
MTEITISGMGSIINNELAVIRQALLEAGFVVEVENEHPSNKSDREHIDHIFDLNYKRGSSIVKIKMDHQPWGG